MIYRTQTYPSPSSEYSLFYEISSLNKLTSAVFVILLGV